MKRRRYPLVECPHCRAQVIPTDAGICPSCYKPIATTTEIPPRRSEASFSASALWTPRQIAILSLFPGIPGGIVISSLNWIRMGLARKAVAHMAGGAAAYCIYLAIFSFVSNCLGVLFALALELGGAYCLYYRMKEDIEKFRGASGRVQAAGWISGLMIGLATDAILIGLNVYFLLALGLIKIPS